MDTNIELPEIKNANINITNKKIKKTLVALLASVKVDDTNDTDNTNNTNNTNDNESKKVKKNVKDKKVKINVKDIKDIKDIKDVKHKKGKKVENYINIDTLPSINDILNNVNNISSSKTSASTSNHDNDDNNDDNNDTITDDRNIMITPTILKYNTNTLIKKIYHISDLHIQLYKRHDEYQSIFNKVYDYLRNEKKIYNITTEHTDNLPLLIVITGDILHSKSDLSPECIHMTYNFIKTLVSIMPVVLIAGNHDININNRDRLDALTPIIADLPIVYPLYYLLNSGVYQLHNIMFYHASIFDYKIINPNNVVYPEEYLLLPEHMRTNIMLYHGRVNGAVLFNGIVMSNLLQTNNNTNKTITPSTFEPYDISLLGDIHKHQFLKLNIAYAGSLIQQNLGEDINEHGLIKWDIETRRGVLHHIQNDWSFATLVIENKQSSYVCNMSKGIHNPHCTLTKNIRIRILYKNTPESYLMDYITLLKLHHNVLQYSWQNTDDDTITNVNADNNADNNVDNNADNNADNNLDNSIQKNKKKQKSIIDITSPDVQNKYIVEYLQTKENNVSQDDIEKIKALNIKQNLILQEASPSYLCGTRTNSSGNSGTSGHFQLLSLKFSNLFAFGKNNEIDFTDFKGVVGIIAANHMGKSSIIDIIVYTLFDEFTRKGTVKDIININKDDFYIKMVLQIGNWTYTIIKEGLRTRVGASVKVEFYRVRTGTPTQERENLAEDTVSKTKARIIEYFGCYEDIIHTSFSIQNDNSCFIDSSNTKRKEELERIMRFEIVKKLGDIASIQFNKDKAIYEHIKKNINADNIVSLQKAKTSAINALALINEDKTNAKNTIQNLHDDILNTTKQINNECNTFINNNCYEDVIKQYTVINNNIANNTQLITQYYNKMNTQFNTSKYNFKSIIQDDNDNNNNSIKDEQLQALKTALQIVELNNSDSIKQINKNIKLLDIDNDKLYKCRKPYNTKLLNSIIYDKALYLDYLETLTSSLNTQLADYESELSILNKQIDHLKLNEKTIDTNTNTILELQKQIITLPSTIINNNPSTTFTVLEIAYNLSLDNLISDMLEMIKNSQTQVSPDLPDLPDFPELSIIKSLQSYTHYINQSKKYCLALEIQDYQLNNSNLTKQIIKQQTELDDQNRNLKQELKQIKEYEKQIKHIETKIYTINTSKAQITMDITNLDANFKLDADITTNKTQRTHYEKQDEDLEAEQTLIKQHITLLNSYSELQIKQYKLNIELEKYNDILKQFETYKLQIETNKILDDTVNNLQHQLLEQEQLLETIEKKYGTEQSNIIKYTALLDQVKRDVVEGREIEKQLRISDLYRNALKQLPYILLLKIQPVLEKKTNDLLTIITDFTVKFDITDNKIDIYLDRTSYIDKSRNILINNASGFERFISSLAIRMALLELSNLPKINFMAIDEGWACFDTHNINNVSIILDYLTNKFDFILTITHLTQIKEHCDIQLSLKKNNEGYSTITY